MKEPKIMNHLTQWQRIVMCTWGMNRRYKYFDFVHEGYSQRIAFQKSRDMSRTDLKKKKYE